MRNEPDCGPLEAIRTGTHGDYFWLTSSYEDYSGTLVKRCPEVFVGYYMVVVATDSGIPRLTENQRTSGWTLRQGLAYSPKLTSASDIFFQRDGHDSPGFDEWYFFTSPTDLGARQEGNPFEKASGPGPGRPMVFVGTPSVTLHDTDPNCEVIRQMFWAQFDWIQPESYAADSLECLTFATRNRTLFDTVRNRLNEGRAFRLAP